MPVPASVADSVTHGADVKVASVPLVVPALFVATTRKWYCVLQASPVITADADAPEAPAASGLCAAVAVLP